VWPALRHRKVMVSLRERRTASPPKSEKRRHTQKERTAIQQRGWDVASGFHGIQYKKGLISTPVRGHSRSGERIKIHQPLAWKPGLRPRGGLLEKWRQTKTGERERGREKHCMAVKLGRARTSGTRSRVSISPPSTYANISKSTTKNST